MAQVGYVYLNKSLLDTVEDSEISESRGEGGCSKKQASFLQHRGQ